MKRVRVKITKEMILLMIDLIAAIILFEIGNTSLAFAVYFSIISIVIISISIFTHDKHRILYSTALEIYTIALQFGLVIPYVVIGRHIISYSDWTLRFMTGPYIVKAVYLSDIAVLCFEIIKNAARNKYGLTQLSNDQNIKDDIAECKKLYFVSCILLGFTVAYFAYYVLFRGTPLFSSYAQFRNSTLFNSPLYHLLLILFYTATLCLTAIWNIRKHVIGWILCGIIVLFFALNGNKGEFLYAMLAALGTRGVSGQKISWKSLLVILLTLFIIIPTITSLRGIGVAQNLSGGISVDYIGAFKEMGGQIRMTEYGLEDFADGSIKLLWGRSYWQPVWNIIVFPFSSLKSVATGSIRAKYPGHGFSQVIESYINLGVIGVLAYFGFVGYMLAKYESKPKDKIHLAYLGSITSILINASRNYFAFVPGQVLLVTAIFYCIRKFKKT